MTVRKMQMCDSEKVADFYTSMGERSTHFFNVNHGNKKRTMEFFENGKKEKPDISVRFHTPEHQATSCPR